MAAISENIRNLRESRKWTKTEMAKRLGLSTYTTITKWECGDNHPRAVDLKTLCKLFNVSSDYLLGIADTNGMECINYYKYYPVAVSAGLLENIDSIDEKDVQWVAIQDDMMGKYSGSSDIFFVKVTGTSMNKVIKDGSRIGIKKVDNFRNLKDGDIVLFSKDNQFSIKRFFNDKQMKRLIFRPESTDDVHTDIVVSYADAKKLEIHGKVIINIAQY